MDHTHFKLMDFFSESEISNDSFSEIEKMENLKTIREKISESMEGLPVPESFMGQIISQFQNLLNMDIRTILFSAWKKSINFEKYLDREKVAPGEAIMLPLADHKITSEHTPYLQPFLNDVALGELKFHIYLNLHLSGVIIKIQDEKITEVTLGSCKGECRVTHENMVLLEKKDIQFALQDSLKLPENLTISNILNSGNVMEQPVAEPALPTQAREQPA